MLSSLLHGGPIPPGRKDCVSGRSPRACHVASRSFGSPGKHSESLIFQRLEARSSQDLDRFLGALSSGQDEYARQYCALSEALIARLRSVMTADDDILDELIDCLKTEYSRLQAVYKKLSTQLQDHFGKSYAKLCSLYEEHMGAQQADAGAQLSDLAQAEAQLTREAQAYSKIMSSNT